MNVFDLTITRKGDNTADLELTITEEQYVGMVRTIQQGGALIFFTEEGKSITDGSTMVNFTDIALMTATVRVVDASRPAKLAGNGTNSVQ